MLQTFKENIVVSGYLSSSSGSLMPTDKTFLEEIGNVGHITEFWKNDSQADTMGHWSDIGVADGAQWQCRRS